MFELLTIYPLSEFCLSVATVRRMFICKCFEDLYFRKMHCLLVRRCANHDEQKSFPKNYPSEPPTRIYTHVWVVFAAVLGTCQGDCRDMFSAWRWYAKRTSCTIDVQHAPAMSQTHSKSIPNIAQTCTTHDTQHDTQHTTRNTRHATHAQTTLPQTTNLDWHLKVSTLKGAQTQNEGRILEHGGANEMNKNRKNQKKLAK